MVGRRVQGRVRGPDVSQGSGGLEGGGGGQGVGGLIVKMSNVFKSNHSPREPSIFNWKSTVIL